MSAPTPPRRAALAAAITGYDGADAASRLVDQADEPAEPVRWVRRWTWPVVVAVVTAFGMVAGGVEAWRAVLVGVGCAIAVWSAIATVSSYRPTWHDDVPGQTFHALSTWEVPGLNGARESSESFLQYLRPRLWSAAEDLLRRRGIDPASDRAREMVGRREYALLSGEDRDPARMTSSVSALCHAVARLAVPDADESAPPATAALRRLAGGSRR